MSHYSNSLTVSNYSLNRFDITVLGIYMYKIYKPMQSFRKPMYFALGFYEALLTCRLLNLVDKDVCHLDLQFHFELMMIFCFYKPCVFPSASPPTSLLPCHSKKKKTIKSNRNTENNYIAASHNNNSLSMHINMQHHPSHCLKHPTHTTNTRHS